MALDIAMGGSTNTVLHILAAAHEAEIDFDMDDIDALSRRVPVPVQGGAGQVRRAHGGRPPRRRHHGDPRRARSAGPHPSRPAHRPHRDARRGARALGHRRRPRATRCAHFSLAAPGGVPTQVAFSQDRPLGRARSRPRGRRHPRLPTTHSRRTAGSPFSRATSPTDGCIVKTAGVDESILKFSGPARVFESQDAACSAILANKINAGRRRGHPLRGAEAAGRACRRCSIRPAT